MVLEGRFIGPNLKIESAKLAYENGLTLTIEDLGLLHGQVAMLHLTDLRLVDLCWRMAKSSLGAESKHYVVVDSYVFHSQRFQ